MNNQDFVEWQPPGSKTFGSPRAWSVRAGAYSPETRSWVEGGVGRGSRDLVLGGGRGG